MKKLTIITVCLNNLAGLKKTAASILQQTYPVGGDDYDWIIIDGGSSDGSKEYILSLKQHLSWYCSEPDGGIYEGMNKGVIHADGEFLLFLNSGDCLHASDTIQICLNSLNEDIDLLRGDMQNIDANGNKKKFCKAPEHITSLALFRWDGIYHQSTFIRRSLLLTFPYDTRFRIAADAHFFRTVFLKYDTLRDATVNCTISDFDICGISSKRGRDEVEQSWKLLLGNFMYNDYMQMRYGTFLAERVVCIAKHRKRVRLMANILLWPLWQIIKFFNFVKYR